jgi:serine O-acetyltransferase
LLQPIYFVLNGLVKIIWGIELPRSATIGPGLYIGHFGGITIAPGVIIGRNCDISQHVTIGLSGQGEKAGVPTIGDNVYIAPGAQVFGKISVGSNVKIGANAVIYKDIPDNAIVVLDPGFKIVSYKGNRNPEESKI